MKIRTQLVLACFLLSVVPLSGIVLYSYQSSRSALEGAFRNEATRMTRQMDRRLAAIRSDLENRLAELSALPLQNLPAGAAENDRQVADTVLLALGDSARLIDSLELQPTRTPEPVRQAAPPPPAAASAPEARREAPRRAAVPVPAAEPPPAVDIGSAIAAAEGHPTTESHAAESLVIEIPTKVPLPSLVWSEEQRERTKEIGRLTRQLSDPSITLEEGERQSIEIALKQLQREFNAEMRASHRRFAEELERAKEMRRELRAKQKKSAPGGAAEQPQHPLIAVTNPASAVSPAPAAAPAPAEPVIAKPEVEVEPREIAESVTVRKAAQSEEKARTRAKEVTLLFGNGLKMPVRRDGAVVANLSAQIRAEEVIARVLGGGGEDGELPFALDRERRIYTRNPQERQTLDRLGIATALAAGQALPKLENWIVAISRDAESGLRVGVARPIGNDLVELRRTAAWNFIAGVALIVIALIGIVPVANHITRDVQLVTAGAERIAQGDLMTRLPVKSHNEFGQLSAAFNKMAEDLSHQQQTIVEQERSRKEQEMHQRMLAMEYERKTDELEEARRFQLSMLPKVVPQHPRYEIAVFTQTATEVGGDYYDFHVGNDGTLSVTVGDATGHGAKAGTMVTVVKTLFAGYDDSRSPASFLHTSAEKIKRMDLGRMAMSLLVARFEPQRVTVAAAGMPPALVHRAASGRVDEIAIEAAPLGTIGSDFADRVVDLASGDTVLFLTDGFPELLDPSGRQLGYAATLDAFAAAAKASSADEVIASIATTAQQWHGSQAPNDDITFVVVRST